MFYSANTLKVGTEESFDEKKDVIYMSSSTFYSKKPLSLSGTYFTLQAGFFSSTNILFWSTLIVTGVQ